MFTIADRTISTTGVLTTVYQVHDENDNKIDKSYENIYFWLRDTILSTGWTDFRQHQKKLFLLPQNTWVQAIHFDEYYIFITYQEGLFTYGDTVFQQNIQHWLDSLILHTY